MGKTGLLNCSGLLTLLLSLSKLCVPEHPLCVPGLGLHAGNTKVNELCLGAQCPVGETGHWGSICPLPSVPFAPIPVKPPFIPCWLPLATPTGLPVFSPCSLPHSSPQKPRGSLENADRISALI